MGSIGYGVNDLSRVTGVVGHGWIEVNLSTGSYEIHGGPAPNLSTQDFIRSVFDDTTITGYDIPSGAYNPGASIGDIRTIADNLPDDVARDVSLAALESAVQAYQNTEYGWFSSHSNTFAQYTGMYIAADLIDRGYTVNVVDFDWLGIYQPGLHNLDEIIELLPDHLQAAARTYAEEVVNAGPESLIGTIIELGGELITTAWDGVTEFVSNAWDAATDLVSDAWDA